MTITTPTQLQAIITFRTKALSSSEAVGVALEMEYSNVEALEVLGVKVLVLAPRLLLVGLDRVVPDRDGADVGILMVLVAVGRTVTIVSSK